MNEEGVREVSDLASRLTYGSERFVANQPEIGQTMLDVLKERFACEELVNEHEYNKLFTPYASIKPLKPEYRHQFEWPLRPEFLSELQSELAKLKEDRLHWMGRQPQSDTPEFKLYEELATEP